MNYGKIIESNEKRIELAKKRLENNPLHPNILKRGIETLEKENVELRAKMAQEKQLNS